MARVPNRKCRHHFDHNYMLVAPYFSSSNCMPLAGLGPTIIGQPQTCSVGKKAQRGRGRDPWLGKNVPPEGQHYRRYQQRCQSRDAPAPSSSPRQREVEDQELVEASSKKSWPDRQRIHRKRCFESPDFFRTTGMNGEGEPKKPAA